VAFLHPSFSSALLFLVNVFFVIHNFVLFPVLFYLFVSRFTPFLFLPLSSLFHSLCHPRLSLFSKVTPLHIKDSFALPAVTASVSNLSVAA